MPRSFIPYARQSILDQDIDAVCASLREEMITRGPLVEEFEEQFAALCEVPHAVAFNSGSAALEAAYFAARLNPHDRVFCSPNTFIVSVAAPFQRGIQPQFVDIDRATGSMDLMQLDILLDFHSSRGRPFIIPVHFAGTAIDMQACDRLIRHPETVVIEDARHALGSFYPTGGRVGSCTYSQMTTFNFNPVNTITTGEGGMVTTRDPELCHRLKLFRNNGIERDAPYLLKEAQPGYYEVHEITGNYHLTSFQAALGLSQLRRLDDLIDKRRRLVERYRSRLSQHQHVKLFSDALIGKTVFHLFVIQIDFQACDVTRSVLMEKLRERGIGTEVHYIPLYYHPALHRDEWVEKEKCAETDAYYQQTLSLPLYVDLSEEDVDWICSELLSLIT